MSSTPNLPRVVDNDRDEITVTLNGKELRGWSYRDEAERRVKMLAAREFVEGWYVGSRASVVADMLEAAKDIISSRSGTYRARNGRSMEIQDESGERMWIVAGDEMFALESAIAKAEASDV